METFMVSLLALCMVGCSSMQPSRYENYSRDGENRVTATGEAANNAAWVHSSTATLGSRPFDSGSGYGARSNANQRNVLSVGTRNLYESAVQTTSSALSTAINQSIRDAFQ